MEGFGFGFRGLGVQQGLGVQGLGVEALWDARVCSCCFSGFCWACLRISFLLGLGLGRQDDWPRYLRFWCIELGFKA